MNKDKTAALAADRVRDECSCQVALPRCLLTDVFTGGPLRRMARQDVFSLALYHVSLA